MTTQTERPSSSTRPPGERACGKGRHNTRARTHTHTHTHMRAHTHTHNPRSYNVYDLESYRLLHALPAAGLRDVRMSGALLAAVRGGAPGESALRVEVISAENGQVGAAF